MRNLTPDRGRQETWKVAPQRRTTSELDTETVQRLVQSLDRSLVASGFSPLEGGSTEVYRIDLVGSDRNPLVLKIYPDEPEWRPSKEILVAGWLKGLTPPVPKWLRVDESRTVLPLRFALLTLLPGRSLRHWMAEPGIDQAYRQMGELLRRIHSVPMPAYGYVLGHGIDKPRSTNADYMTAAFEDVFRRFRDLGGDADLGRHCSTWPKEASISWPKATVPYSATTTSIRAMCSRRMAASAAFS
ncbi:phosphotransferase family protein [Bradyrhizobium valentinum]|uniref:phosphotransferase family protein n=1 Tax=Bradyrhizobium valentinum TaxID=1518501 RepID=UPI001FDA07C5|nr:aminoglycoside phosphotransferase family protein [Bradyrhizobium valentinum]